MDCDYPTLTDWIKKLVKVFTVADEYSDLINFQQDTVNWKAIAEIADNFFTAYPKLIHEGD